MSLYAFLDRNVFLPIGEKIMKRNISGALQDSYKIDWLSKEDLYELQCRKLQDLVLHCYKNVPYYTNLFDSLGLSPNEIKCREDLSKLPILTKELIKQHYDDLKSKDIVQRKRIDGSTGGSTGTPMRFISDINTWNRLMNEVVGRGQ